ncbi:hypothetical protein [Mucilaginibacter terrae]|uniref:Uncharacterized protein n=1 Tax=Mucilaginibacter terrae TaxID=1955052 RepID=A0ABU3H099_9SPHI|nr:hypothetical protein [Mucilaginibacter terrae]MDT3405111.1 hypothetical protein [Mucilaginibacter terrae]
MLHLFLNDVLVDLSDDSPIALTFQINNLAEVKNQQGNTSNQFKLPLTQHNRQVLGFPDDVAFTTDAPYKQYAAKLVQDGMEIIPYGLAELNSVENNTAAITVLSGNVDFFDAIDGKIYETGDPKSIWYNTGWNQYLHNWTLANVVASQRRTNGWIWPVVDYGKIPKDFTGTPKIDVRYLRPGFFLKSFIELMVNKTGYTINPDSFLLKQPLYDKLIVQFANDNFEHGTGYDSSKSSNLSLEAVSSRDQSYVYGQNGANEDFFFSNVVKGQNVFSSGKAYVATTDIEVDISLQYRLRYQSTNTKGAVTISIKKYGKNGGTPEVLVNKFYNADGATVQNLGFVKYYTRDLGNEIQNISTKLTTGESLRVWWDIEQDVKKVTGFTLYNGAKFLVTEKPGKMLYGHEVQCERIFPDIGQKDLLKDTLQRFGIICQTDAGRRMITLASFRDIVNNIPQAKDWTAKCLDQGKSITFQLGNYAQNNYLKNKEDDNIPPGTADSVIEVKDKTLPATGTLFESQFAPTLNRPYIGGNIAQINKVDISNDADAVDFSISTQPRLLIHNITNLQNGQQVEFTDGTGANHNENTAICTPYFDKPGGEHSLHFEKLRQLYYPELEKILRETKKVVRYFLLTPRDILELDLLIPIYIQQDGAYYYINKIDIWRKGQSTKVELIKLG